MAKKSIFAAIQTKLMGKKLLFICGCLLLQLFSIAQSTKTARDSSTLIIFNQNTSHTPVKHSGENNIIKIAPLGFLSGTFPLLYERKINDFFSIELSGGVTGKNYSRTVFAQNEDGIKYQYPWTNSNYTDLSEHIYSFTYRTAKPGYMFSLQPRFYFNSDALDGAFMGLSYDYYRYNFNIPALLNDNGDFTQNGPVQQEHENINDYMVHFGLQNLYDKLTFEYTIGLGLRNISGLKYVAATDDAGDIVDGFATYKQSTINFNIGIKVGYHF